MRRLVCCVGIGFVLSLIGSAAGQNWSDVSLPSVAGEGPVQSPTLGFDQAGSINQIGSYSQASSFNEGGGWNQESALGGGAEYGSFNYGSGQGIPAQDFQDSSVDSSGIVPFGRINWKATGSHAPVMATTILWS